MVSLLSRRPLRTALLTALAFGTIGFGAAYAKVHLGAHPGLPLHTVKADARPVSGRVIVIMRDQISGQPATRAAIGKRIGAEAGVDAPVIAKVRRSGGRIRERYHALNGFAATVSDGEPCDRVPRAR